MAVPQVLEKHKRYLTAHQPNDLYWGIGLEEEFYLELEHPLRVTTEHILQNQRPERYSVNYFTSFKEDPLKEALSKYLTRNKNPLHKIPILVNSHSLASTDADGQPRTTYAKQPKPNPKFSGTSVHHLLTENSKWFKDNYKKVFCYDGNTFEIMTQNFYKTTAELACEELRFSKQRFIEEIRPTLSKIPLYAQHGSIHYMSGNHGLATYMTNYGQINPCNNGTLHVSLTMPTLLNAAKEPADEERFFNQHLQAARLIQWLEPLLVAMHGEPDFLSCVDNRFSASTQRGAISRYIGIANYDTNEATQGKLLTTNQIPIWYETYHATSAYRQLEEIGFDIQFRKFPNHGLELRIFDRLPDSCILPLVRFLVLLLDQSLALRNNSLLVKAPQTYAAWNAWLIDILRNGKKARADAALLSLYEELLGCRLPSSGTPEEIYKVATAHLEKTYATTGECAVRMLNQVREPAALQKKSIICCH